jgi:teichuronic acid biosynthesis glycosyltransferase TuaC
MKVLFVSSGNTKAGISPIINNQGLSLQKNGIDVTYFTIIGKGVKGYTKSIKVLRHLLKTHTFDVVHAHYSLSAFVASLAGAQPLIVSLMGSDVKSKLYFKYIIKLFDRYSWSKTIVKSEDMKLSLGIKDVFVIPNGVDYEKFRPLPKEICKNELGWDTSKIQILFAGSPKNKVKNYPLAQAVISLLAENDYELKVLDNIPNEKMPIYHNAADVVMLTSLWEGSPNVIKEAMACNRPIVSTDVGDVKSLIQNTLGCYITDSNPQNISRKIKIAVQIESCTIGRMDIKHLEESTIAKQIIDLYQAISIHKQP